MSGILFRPRTQKLCKFRGDGDDIQGQKADQALPHVARVVFEDPPDDVVEIPGEVPERARKQNELAKKLGWQPERLAQFKQLALTYEKDPTIANYLQIRRDFPETEKSMSGILVVE